MLPDPIQSLELDSESMDELIGLLNDQREEIVHALPRAEKDIKELETKLLINPGNREIEKALEVAKLSFEHLNERLARNERLETLVENARPANQDLVIKGDQAHRFNSRLTKNQLAKAEVAQHFASVLLERITSPSNALSAEGLNAINTALGNGRDMAKLTSDLRDVIEAANIIAHSCKPETESARDGIVEVELFLIELREMLMNAAQEDDKGATLEQLLQECEVDQIGDSIDWPRAVPKPQRVPNLYPAAQTVDSGMPFAGRFSNFPGR